MEPHPRYQLLEKIGSGSYATVYRARDLELQREVAIKQIHQQYLDDPQQLERYWAEAQLLASFQHPNIVTIYDIVRERGWLVLELMQGSLVKVAGRKQLDLNALRATLAHCLRALKFLHEHGIVHGDIKPGNMMIDRRKRVKIGDFGLARRVSDAEGSLIKGTTKYMAPEVVSDEFGSVGPASDLYSLGFSGFELMCGENFESLFPGLNAFGRDKQMAWLMWHSAPDRRLPEISRIVADVPEDLARCLQKLTAKSQAERYKSADEALSDLKIDIKLVKTGEEPEPASEGMSAAGKRRLLAITAFAASLLLCLAMLLPGKKKGENLARIPLATGIVREISLSPPKLTLEDEAGIPLEVAIGEKPRIQLNYDIYILTKDLHKGDRVEIQTVDSPEGERQVKIIALRPEQTRGIIKSINNLDQTVIVSIDEGRSDIPLRIAKGSHITLNGRKVSLVDLKTDDRVETQHLKNTEGSAARVVTRFDALRSERVIGFIRALDAPRNRLTIEQPGGREQQTVQLEVGDNCHISLNGETTVGGKAVMLADLAVNDRVVLQFDVRISEVVATRNPRASGVIMQVVESPPTVYLQSRDGQQTPYRVEGAVDINLNRARASLMDLRKFDAAEITLTGAGKEATAKSIDAGRPLQSDRLVVLIAVQNYQDHNLSQLKSSRADAELIRAALIQRYAVLPERILYLADPDRQSLRHGLNEWLQKSDNLSQVWVYFCGNAYLDDSGTAYLAASDTKWNQLAETGIKLESLVNQLETTVAREKILLLDASQASRGAEQARQPSSPELVESLTLSGGSGASLLKSVSVIASCRKGEAGQYWSEKEHGVFAWFIAAALSGSADKNRDLILKPTELQEYLRKQMSEPLGPGQPVQTPVLFQH